MCQYIRLEIEFLYPGEPVLFIVLLINSVYSGSVCTQEAPRIYSSVYVHTVGWLTAFSTGLLLPNILVLKWKNKNKTKTTTEELLDLGVLLLWELDQNLLTIVQRAML